MNFIKLKVSRFCHFVTVDDHQNPEIFLRECRDKAHHCFDFTSDMQYNATQNVKMKQN